MKFHCPRCRIALEAGETAAGKIVSCPGCHSNLKVPGQVDPGSIEETRPSSPIGATAASVRRGSGERCGHPLLGLGFGILGLVTWIVPLVGFPITLTGLTISALALKRKGTGMAIAGIVICALGLHLCVLSSTLGTYRFSRVNTEDGNAAPSLVSIAEPMRTAAVGLTREELPMAAATIYGLWIEKDAVVDDTSEWFGSAGVILRKDGMLLLFTNKHCLGLDEYFQADPDGMPELGNYSLTVEFPTGRKAPVHRLAIHKDEIDIALLVVSESGLSEGKDYVILAFDEGAVAETGSEVVAVGSPLELQGTQTYGRISAMREFVAGESAYRMIQIDAAINPGNSGGPLFLSREGRFTCIGVNTMKMPDAESLGFAIDRKILASDRFEWLSMADLIGRLTTPR